MIRKLLINLEGEGTGAGASGAGAAAGAKGTTGAPAGAGTEGTKGTTGAPAEKEESLIEEEKPEESLVDDAEGKKGEKGKGKAEAKDAPADFKLKLPEGMDAKVADPYMAAAKKHGLKGEAAQEFFDLAVQAGNEARAAYEDEVMAMAAQTRKDWLDTARKDKEIGGDKFNENVALANKFVRAVGGTKLMEVLKKSGIAVHPEVLRAFAKAGRSISEDSISGTTGGGKKEGTLSKKAQLKQEFPKSPGMWEHLPDE